MNDTPNAPPPEIEDRPTPSRAPLFALAAAAIAVVAAVLLWPRMQQTTTPPSLETLRGESAAAGVAEPLEPLGSLAGPLTQFRWSRDPQADSYQLEIYDTSGHVIAAAFVRDTLVPAVTLGVDTLRAGSWLVVPIAADGAERQHHPPANFVATTP